MWLLLNLFLRRLSQNQVIDLKRKLDVLLGYQTPVMQTASREVENCLILLGEKSEKIAAIDVGANVGEWSRSLLQVEKSAFVYAFEPAEKSFLRLCSNLSRFENCEIFNFALSSESEMRLLFSDSHSSPLATFQKRSEFGEQPLKELVEVKRLDQIKNIIDLPQVSILKIDAEGSEFDVLIGAGSLLSRIEVVQFELSKVTLLNRLYFKDFFDFLTSYGFELYRDTAWGLSLVDEYSADDEHFTTHNMYARRRSR